MSIELEMLANHLILCCPLLLLPSIFPSIRLSSNESTLHIRWLKYWNFSISPSNVYWELISFRIGWLAWSPCCPRDFEKSSLAPQFESINSSVFCCLYGQTLTYASDYWKDHSFDHMDLCQQNNVFAFWYTVQVCHSFSSKEQASFNFMAACTTHSNFRFQEEICHCFHLFPSICHEVMGPDAMLLVFFNIEF